MPVLTKVSELGKLNIPAQIRRQTGLERGGPVVMTVVAGEIRLRPVRAMLARLQSDADAVFGGTGETVERFLSERRAEAAQEEEGQEAAAQEEAGHDEGGRDKATRA